MTMYMPEDQSRTGLHTIDGQNIALQSVNVEVAFSNLFCDTIMTQAYRNLENTPIEAVYTFPLTSRAVLLGMDVMIGDRKLQGVVVERSSAEEQYEEAIINGDAAIMLEQIQPGLYTMNVGNIGAGEEVRVQIRYAELYAWQGNSLRFHLPTTIAPRYGHPEKTGLQPHQIPHKIGPVYDGEHRACFRLFQRKTRWTNLSCHDTGGRTAHLPDGQSGKE
ncbi:MAG: VIT domain-containing protein [Desulfoprunum sp.]|jgi:Ca-activated chloride channel family protein|uniref:VIT domain-containing protein n=1 Tax=Desulfoprunum sp. TaxID=2020866 RepID=UPI000A9B3A00